jgi:hypothetical protein
MFLNQNGLECVVPMWSNLQVQPYSPAISEVSAFSGSPLETS